MKNRFRDEVRRNASTFMTKNAEIVEGKNKKIEKEKHAIENRQLGPRFKFRHEVFNHKKNLNDAIEQILQEFPALSREIVLGWYYDEKAERTNLKEKNEDGR